MPFLHIRSQAFPEARDTGPLLDAIRLELAQAAALPPDQISVSWTFLAEQHPAVAGLAMALQSRDARPVLAELRVTEDGLDAIRSEDLLKAAVAGIARHAGIPEEQVFVAYRPASADSDTDFDTRSIVRW
ncbi:hypothetical protein [Zoogloea sp. LCSB751]|uniref:hypothetical protein n=1 Tax=Zoogloea sp. LCSB751 TaxID=1965277 RepID=UPI0009A4CDCA|nr:hypothetical protein [Zoogloea sp. LCSB751]